MSDEKPQVGASKPAPTAPPQRPAQPAFMKANLDAPKAKTVLVPKPKPEGWFSFNAKGLRPAVLKSVQDSKDLPDGWKAAITGDITELDASLNFLDVHCHRHMEKGKAVVNFTLNSSAVLS